jgi:hypothetical protein
MLGGGHTFGVSEVSGACSTDNRSTIMIVAKGGPGARDL